MYRYRSLLGGSLGLVLVVFLYIIQPTFPVVPHGILLPSHTISHSIKESEVKLVSRQESMAAASHAPVGLLRIEFHGALNDSNQTQVIAFAKKLASQAGSDMIIVDQFGHTPMQVDSIWQSYRFSGQAVRTSESAD